MPFLVKKQVKGNTYYYLRHNHRVDGKSKTAWQIYLGSEDSLQERGKITSLDYETKTIEFGLIAALLHIAEKLNIVDIINNNTSKRDQGLSVGHHMLFAALNRCVQPTTKTQMNAWFEGTLLQRHYPDIFTTISLDSRAYWSHFRYLTSEVIEKIENGFIKNTNEIFNINLNNLSFDPTNFFTYINPNNSENQSLPKHGHSKEGRATLNLVNLSLFTTLESGIPLFHLSYPGNVHDSTHFKDSALPALMKRLKILKIDPKSITLIFDKGNLSVEAFKIIEESGLNFICSDRPSSHKDKLDCDLDKYEMYTLPNGKEVGLKEFWAEKYNKKRRFINIYNPRQADWSKNNLEEKIRKKVEKINTYFDSRLSFSPGEKKRGQADKWRKRTEVEDKVKSMIGGTPYRDIIKFEIEGPDEISLLQGGELKLKVFRDKVAVFSQENRLGKSFLMTSHKDVPLDKIVWEFRQQYLVERAFKWLKNGDFLSIRPMFHRVDNSIRGHVFVCYVGLLLLSLLVHELINSGVQTSIFKAMTHLREIKQTYLYLGGKKKPLVTFDKMSLEAKEIFDLLDLKRFQ